jgi:hypothetical protein
MIKKLLHITACLFLTTLFIISCKKEFSFEGTRPYVPAPVDTIKPILPPAPWICPSCIGKDVQIEKKWSLFIDGAFFCGDVDTAIVIAPDRSGFTFFGPSSCSVDSGLVFTVFLNGEFLNKDIRNLVTQNVSFFYYDKIGQTIAYASRRDIPFSFAIESYVHQTRTATGNFSGPVTKANGAIGYINSGKFKIQLK